MTYLHCIFFKILQIMFNNNKKTQYKTQTLITVYPYKFSCSSRFSSEERYSLQYHLFQPFTSLNYQLTGMLNFTMRGKPLVIISITYGIICTVFSMVFLLLLTTLSETESACKCISQGAVFCLVCTILYHCKAAIYAYRYTPSTQLYCFILVSDHI